MDIVKYRVVTANYDLINRVSSQFSIKNRYDGQMYVAVSPENDILGYTNTFERTLSLVVDVPCRFLHWVKVVPQFRRQGIATTLVKHAIEQAQHDGVKYIYGSCEPTETAHEFWNSMRFCFAQYGKMCDDLNKTDEYGNFRHFIQYRIGKPLLYKPVPSGGFASMTTKDEIKILFETYLGEHLNEFWHKKINDLSGFKISDINDNILGFAVAYESDAGKPLTFMQWDVAPYIYSENNQSNFKSALICEMIRFASKANITQIITRYEYEKTGSMWIDNGFAIGYPLKTQDGKLFLVGGIRTD